MDKAYSAHGVMKNAYRIGGGGKARRKVTTSKT
jgi:hypothetical protein